MLNWYRTWKWDEREGNCMRKRIVTKWVEIWLTYELRSNDAQDKAYRPSATFKTWTTARLTSPSSAFVGVLSRILNFSVGSSSTSLSRSTVHVTVVTPAAVTIWHNENIQRALNNWRIASFSRLERMLRHAVADSGRGRQTGHAPIQSDSLAINFEFDMIRKMHTLWSIDSQEN